MTVELNNICYKEDIITLSIKNVGANKLSVLDKNIVIP
jgi:hypothetical protein